MTHGCVALVLHAHLPFVRHPELPESLEERWLFEALTETYLPLLDVLEGLARDRVQARFTLSLSPTLLAMFGDELLRARYRRHVEALLRLSEREVERTRDQPEWRACATLYLDRLTRTRDRYLTTWREDVTGAFRGHEEAGRVELATTSATHAVLPIVGSIPAFARAQIAIGIAEHRRWFGKRPAGFWLPECGFAPGLDDELARAAVRWCVLDTHGVTHATPQPVYGVYAPIACPSGVLAYGRDPDSATQVWSAEAGYPADPWYRDFHRDIGFDLPAHRLAPFATDEARMPTGLKYHRVTGDTDAKEPYEPARAAGAGGRPCSALRGVPPGAGRTPRRDHGPPAGSGLPLRRRALRPLVVRGTRLARRRPARHRRHARAGGDHPVAGRDRHPVAQRAVPAASTWGWRGHHGVWLQRTNDWIYPRLHRAGEALLTLAATAAPPGDWRRRTLTQAFRELLLAQASDWAFMMARGTTVEYAERRTLGHIDRCTRLCDAVARGTPDDALLETSEAQAPLFPALDLAALR